MSSLQALKVRLFCRISFSITSDWTRRNRDNGSRYTISFSPNSGMVQNLLTEFISFPGVSHQLQKGPAKSWVWLTGGANSAERDGGGAVAGWLLLAESDYSAQPTNKTESFVNVRIVTFRLSCLHLTKLVSSSSCHCSVLHICIPSDKALDRDRSIQRAVVRRQTEILRYTRGTKLPCYVADKHLVPI